MITAILLLAADLDLAKAKEYVEERRKSDKQTLSKMLKDRSLRRKYYARLYASVRLESKRMKKRDWIPLLDPTKPVVGTVVAINTSSASRGIIGIKTESETDKSARCMILYWAPKTSSTGRTSLQLKAATRRFTFDKSAGRFERNGFTQVFGHFLIAKEITKTEFLLKRVDESTIKAILKK